MKTLIVGASGATGKQLTEQLLADQKRSENHYPTSFKYS